MKADFTPIMFLVVSFSVAMFVLGSAAYLIYTSNLDSQKKIKSCEDFCLYLGYNGTYSSIDNTCKCLECTGQFCKEVDEWVVK